MLFDEEKMIKLCNKYGIEVADTGGIPTLEGKPLLPGTFSIEEIMNAPVCVDYEEDEEEDE